MPEGAGYCHKCGAQLPEGAIFCPKCGAAVVSAAPPQPGVQQPSRVERREKTEKHGEKHEKNEKGEKGSGGSVLGAVVGGLILIWLGTTFFLEQNGYIPSDIWWAYFLAGLGTILIVQGIVIFARGRSGLGSMIGGAILVFIGLSTITTNQLNFSMRLWPLFIVAIGVFILFASLASRGRVPKP